MYLDTRMTRMRRINADQSQKNPLQIRRIRVIRVSIDLVLRTFLFMHRL